ncbi:MAG: PqqD family protein [Acidimicrobiia bacterium]
MAPELLRLRRQGLEWLTADGEIVALDLESSNYLATNPSGALLWGALVGGATRKELVSKLVEAFGVDPEGARADVDAFVAQLSEQGLLEGE